MDSVEQTFDISAFPIRSLGAGRIVHFRGRTLELHDLAGRLGLDAGGAAKAGVVVWAGGRRCAFAVEGLVGQSVFERIDLPTLAHGRSCSGVVLDDHAEIIPILEPGAVIGAWEIGGSSFGFSGMEESALLEVANIGSSHAATALSNLLGRPVEIRHTEAMLTTIAEAADRAGAPASPSAVVDTPVAGDGGKVLLLFPEEGADRLCRLLGSSIDQELGRSTLREVGNILASSYLNAVVEMTGVALEPEPPEMTIDVLGSVFERSLGNLADVDTPTILMRSLLVVDTEDAGFSFLFIPRLAAVRGLLEALGLSPVEA